MAVKLLRKNERTLPVAEVVEVTPKMAQGWLDSAAHNRNVVNIRVEQFAAMMKRGDWLVTGQGIIFNEKGELIDGQHRLMAIVLAGVPVHLLVVRDVIHRAQLVMDQGTRRTPHDQIKLREGIEVLPIHVAVAKQMIASVGGAGSKTRDLRMTDIQLLDRFYMHHHKAIEFAVSTYWGKSSVRGITIAPVFAPVARAFYNHPQHVLRRFVDVVVTGESVAEDELPAVALRNYLIAGRDRGLSSMGYKDRRSTYCKTEVALKAFIKGTKIQRLYQMTTEVELFPLPEEKK